VTWRTGWAFHDVLTAPQSLGQNAYAEPLIGSIRRECLDHVIVFHSAAIAPDLKQLGGGGGGGAYSLLRRCRTYLSLEKDAPVSRTAEPPSFGPCDRDPKGRLTALILHAQSA